MYIYLHDLFLFNDHSGWCLTRHRDEHFAFYDEKKQGTGKSACMDPGFYFSCKFKYLVLVGGELAKNSVVRSAYKLHSTDSDHANWSFDLDLYEVNTRSVNADHAKRQTALYTNSH